MKLANLKKYFDVSVKPRSVLTFTSFLIGLSFLFLFQNCENFGAFIAFEELSSTDPHQDSWRPVQGLEVKNGEWVKVEDEVQDKVRLADRHYITSKLINITVQGDEASVANQAIKHRLNQFVAREIGNFGGPCNYNNPERLPLPNNTFANCNGLALHDVFADVIPSANVFRSSIKKAACDYLASDATVQTNIVANIGQIQTLVDSDSIPLLMHQLFYLGQQPRKRTLASLEDLYKAASSSSDVTAIENRGVKMLTLALCHSNGWEAP